MKLIDKDNQEVKPHLPVIKTILSHGGFVQMEVQGFGTINCKGSTIAVSSDYKEYMQFPLAQADEAINYFLDIYDECKGLDK